MSSVLLVLLWYFFSLIPTFALPSDSTGQLSWHSTSSPSSIISHDNSTRRVILIVDINVEAIAVTEEPVRNEPPAHPILLLESTAQEGALRIDLSSSKLGQWYVRSVDFGNQPAALAFDGPNSGVTRLQTPIGETTVSNLQMVDAEDGTGIIARAWSENAHFDISTNNGNSLMRRLIAHLNSEGGGNLAVPPRYVDIMAVSDTWTKNVFPRLVSHSPSEPLVYYQVENFDAAGNKVAAVFNLGSSAADLPTPSTVNAHTVTEVPFRNAGLGSSGVKASDLARDRNLALLCSIPGKRGKRPTGDGPYKAPTAKALARRAAASIVPRDRAFPLSKRGAPLGRRQSSKCPANANDPESKLRVQGSTDIAMVRSGGQISTVLSFTQDAMKAVGLGLLVATPIIVILDFINGNWHSALLSAASLALGIAAESAIGGPIGFLVGLAVGALFAILPGLFNTIVPPRTNDPAEIIQYAFFGNPSTTGNEKCNEQRKQAGLSQNCTAVYGPGVIAKAFKWETFDAFAFLIQFNQGYAMSIPDIAAAFQILDYTNSSSQINNTIATIDCGKHVIRPVLDRRMTLAGRANMLEGMPGGGLSRGPPTIQAPSAGYLCSNPRFELDRSKIQIPFVNASASDIYKRIIPNPGGDCKLVSDGPNGLNLSTYNLTITGRPSAIACNLSSSIILPGDIDPNSGLDSWNSSSPVNGTSQPGAAVPCASGNGTTCTAADGTDMYPGLSLDSVAGQITWTTGSATVNTGGSGNSTLPSNSTTFGSSTGNATESDGSPGRASLAYVPAPKPFANLTEQNTVCMRGDTNETCFPSGTFSTQGGAWGFDMGKVNTLIAPPGTSMNWTYVDVLHGGKYTATQNVPITFNGTITGSDANFTTTLKKQMVNRAWSVNAPSAPACICLFSETNYLGNVKCYGAGGGPVDSYVQNKAQSLIVRGGANVWLFADSYGDAGGAQTNTDIADLTGLPYGDNGNFAGKIKALYVIDPSRASGSASSSSSSIPGSSTPTSSSLPSASPS